MAIDSKFYMHDSDRLALDALKAIPGFSQVLKAFMKVWNEKQFYIRNMSTNVRISEKQLSKYYNMLPPICEKLGIEVPELYLTLDPYPNAMTYGDTKPFIVITSGLLETLPEELIPSVLAHECGHIACHHVLYHTMAQIILNEGINILGGNNDIALLSIQVAFYYWKRCSEFSADRAAIICDGTADKMIEVCMRLAGFDKDIHEEINVEAFLEQAVEYKKLVDDNVVNKTMEFMMFGNKTHPLTAVRAYECNEWGKTDKFNKINKFLDEYSTQNFTSYMGEVPMDFSSKAYHGRQYQEVQQQFLGLGFENVVTVKVTTKSIGIKDGQVTKIYVNNKEGFDKLEWISIDSKITIEFYEPETEEEIAAAHPGQSRVPNSSKRYIGKNYIEVVEELKEQGFLNIEVEKIVKSKKTWLDKDDSIAKISINGQTQFDKGEWFDKNSQISITYSIFSK